MLDWRREGFVWVPADPVGTLQPLGLEAQSLVVYLAKYADADGIVRLDPAELCRAIGRLCGINLGERNLLRVVVAESFEAGAIAPDGRTIRLPEFRAWQHTRDPRRRLYRREGASFARLPLFARALAGHFVRTVDADGIARCRDADEWTARATLAQYARGDLNRQLAERVVARVRALVSEGFLVTCREGFRVRNFTAAQRLHVGDVLSTVVEATARPQPTPVQAPAKAQPSRSRPPPIPQPTPVQATGTINVTTRKDTIDVRPSVPSVSALPASAATAGAVVAAAAATKQGELFQGEPSLPRAGKGRRRATDDLTLPTSHPAAAVAAVIAGCPELARITVKPCEFAVDALATYTLIDVGYHVRRATEYLRAHPPSAEPYVNGRAFLRKWLHDEQMTAEQTMAPSAVLAKVRTSPRAGAVSAAPRFASSESYADATSQGVAVALDPWAKSVG